MSCWDKLGVIVISHRAKGNILEQGALSLWFSCYYFKFYVPS